MKYMKRFRVLDCIFRPHDRSHSVILISPDGQSFEVKLRESSDWQELRPGLVVEMPLVKVQDGQPGDFVMCADWSLLGDEWEPVVYPNLFEMITKSWGREEAAKHLPPESRPDPEMNSPPIPPPAQPKVRRRRAKKSDVPPPEVS